jgi:hypothetical protein
MRYLILVCVWTSLTVFAFSEGAILTEAQSSVTIQVQSAGGAPVLNDLVIVKSVDKYADVLRALTDKNGNAPPVDLKPGLYRAITTDPYGLWQTAVREFLVKTGQTEMQVVVTTELEPLLNTVVVGKAAQAHVRVLQADGSAASSAKVMVRSRDLAPNTERWYQTGANGSVAIDLTANPTVVVVVYGDILVTREITNENSTLVVQLPGG